MKKFQTMMAVVLVALMAFAVQSCGSDDEDNSRSYRMEFTAKVTNPGPMTPAQVATFEAEIAKRSATQTFQSDEVAATATGMAATALAEGLAAEYATIGDIEFTITIKTTKVKENKLIEVYYVTYKNGVTDYYSGKN